MTTVQTWPADPASAWAESRVPLQSTGSDAGAIFPGPRRRPLPPVARLEDFLRFVPVMRGYIVFAVAFVLFGVICGVAALMASGGGTVPAPVARVIFAVLSVGCLATAVIAYVHGRRSFPSRRLGYYERVAREGVVCDVFESPFRVDEGDGYANTRILIDSALPDEQARRIVTAFDVWLTRLTHDERASRAARARFGRSRAYGSAEIFGAEAAGGFLVRDNSRPGSWCLMLPGDATREESDESADFPYRGATILRVSDRERPLATSQRPEPVRRAWKVTAVDFVGMVLVVGIGAVGYFGFNAWATGTNFWWDACADKFCAMDHDLRLFALTFVGAFALAGGLVVPPLLAARLGSRPLRTVFALLFVLLAGACMVANVVLAQQSPIE